MANNEFPAYNGFAPSWGDMSCQVSGLDVTLLELDDIKSINTESAIEVGQTRKGGRPDKTTTGQLNNNASIVLYYAGWRNFVRRLAQACVTLGGRYVRGDQQRVGLVHFNLRYAMELPNTDEIAEIELNGVRYLGRTFNGSEGTDPTEVDCALNVKEIVDPIDEFNIVML